MTTIDAHLAAERDSIIQFLKGRASVTGRFWLVNLLRFNPGGQAEYEKYVSGLETVMADVGARPVFCSYNCRTVIDGAGNLMPVDGVFIGEYPSPSALIEMNKSDGYKAAHHHRTAALAETAMYAISPGWVTTQRPLFSGRRADPSVKAPESKKAGKQLEAIDGNPEDFMQFVGDERFQGDSPIWMLNFLQFEPPPADDLYFEYAARAQSKIGRLEGTGGRSGGLTLSADKVHTLKGFPFHHIAVMCYPSRDAFVEYAVGRGSGLSGAKDEVMAEGFKLRQAGLAVQGLICMSPQTVYDPTDRVHLQARL